MRRDFTYIDDLVESIVRLLPKVAVPNPDWNGLTPDPHPVLHRIEYIISETTVP
jgi:nucleoside-diphosphate-sugar epimerase